MEANQTQALSGVVKTNQRGLITKILSRYASDFFALKELLQNADDAGATAVRIVLEEDKTGNGSYDRVTIQNNGRPFRPEDWDRIRTIASGNPDERTVGYFGVGFFSTFALSDAPVIYSGAGAMRFFWGEGGQLFTRFEALQHPPGSREAALSLLAAQQQQQPPQYHHPCTEFVLPLKREAEAATWRIDALEQFLSKALLFPRHLETVHVVRGGQPVLELRRAAESPTRLRAGQAACARQTPGGLFQLNPTGIDVGLLHLSVRRGDGSAESCTLRTVSSRCTVGAGESAQMLCHGLGKLLGKQIARETTVSLLFDDREPDEWEGEATLERSAPTERKQQPQQPNVVLLRPGQAAPPAVAVSRQAEGNPPLAALLSPLGASRRERRGRIFVGFETHQMCGTGYHVSGPFFPTMERTALDFAATHVSRWNQELVSAAGLVSRAYYDHCFNQLTADLDVGLGSTQLFPELSRATPGSALAAADPRKGPAAMTASASSRGPSWDKAAQQASAARMVALLEEMKADPLKSLAAGCGAHDRRAVHLLRSHVCLAADATPQNIVGQLLAATCWQVQSHPMRLLSTQGPTPCQNVLLVPRRLQGASRFLKRCTLLPEATQRACAELFAPSRDAGVGGKGAKGKAKKGGGELLACGVALRELDGSAVLAELPKTIFDEQEAVLLLSWYARVKGVLFPSSASQRAFAGAVQLQLGNGCADQRTAHLSSFCYHAEVGSGGGGGGGSGAGIRQRLHGLPLPADTLPIAISQHLSQSQLQQFKPLPFWHWWVYTRDHAEDTFGCAGAGGDAAPFSYAVPLLAFIAQQCALTGAQQSMTAAQKKALLASLATTRCVPALTEQEVDGPVSLHLPNATYMLQDTNQREVFGQDLPRPHNSAVQAVGAAFLVQIGVRTQPSVAQLLSYSSQLGWGWPKTVRFLLQQQPPEVQARVEAAGGSGKKCHECWNEWLHRDDIATLRERARPQGAADASFVLPSLPPAGQAHRSCTLHVASEQIRLLPWGNPPSAETIQRMTSTEAAFLLFIGVKKHPALTDLLQLSTQASQLSAASEDAAAMLPCPAFRYLVAHMDVYKQELGACVPARDAAWVPSQVSPDAPMKLLRADTCFLAWNPFGFPVLADVYASEELRCSAGAVLKLVKDPPLLECVSALVSAPPGSGRHGRAEARSTFAYMGTRVAELDATTTGVLRAKAWVPVELSRFSERQGVARVAFSGAWSKPDTVFFDVARSRYGDLLQYTDLLGYYTTSPQARSFLRHAGVRDEPTPTEFANLIAQHNGRVIGSLRYIRLLELLQQQLWRSNPGAADDEDTPSAAEAELVCTVAKEELQKLAEAPFALNAKNLDDPERVLARTCYIIDTLRFLRFGIDPPCAPNSLVGHACICMRRRFTLPAPFHRSLTTPPPLQHCAPLSPAPALLVARSPSAQRCGARALCRKWRGASRQRVGAAGEQPGRRAPLLAAGGHGL